MTAPDSVHLSLSVHAARQADYDAVESLLSEARLGSEELKEHLQNFFLAEIGGRIVGTIGLEIYGEDGLLRSAAVRTEYRSKGIGEKLVRRLIEYSQQRGIRRLVLLTTTAEKYFASKGFVRVPRGRITGAILTSAQFTYACPTSAAVMVKSIGGAI